MMDGNVGLIARLLFCLVGIVVWIWIIRPVDKAARIKRHPTQYTIVDFLSLFVLVQFTTGLIFYGIASDDVAERILSFNPWWFVCGLIWWIGVEVMSRAGINRSWHRVALLIVVLPVAVVSTFTMGIVAHLFLAALEQMSLSSFLVVLGITLGEVVAMATCAYLVRRIVASTDVVDEEP